MPETSSEPRPAEIVAAYLDRARKQEVGYVPVGRWENRAQEDRINELQAKLHDEALRRFGAYLSSPEEDPDVRNWMDRSDRVRYMIFHAVYVAVYEARQDVPFEEEALSFILVSYVGNFMALVQAQPMLPGDPVPAAVFPIAEH